MQDQFKILSNLTFTSVLIQVSKCAKEMEGTGLNLVFNFFENITMSSKMYRP